MVLLHNLHHATLLHVLEHDVGVAIVGVQIDALDKFVAIEKGDKAGLVDNHL